MKKEFDIATIITAESGFSLLSDIDKLFDIFNYLHEYNFGSKLDLAIIQKKTAKFIRKQCNFLKDPYYKNRFKELKKKIVQAQKKEEVVALCNEFIADIGNKFGPSHKLNTIYTILEFEKQNKRFQKNKKKIVEYARQFTKKFDGTARKEK